MTPADLRAWRLARGLTQPEAATVLGVSHRWYAYAEAGRNSYGAPRPEIPARIELRIMKAEGRLPFDWA